MPKNIRNNGGGNRSSNNNSGWMDTARERPVAAAAAAAAAIGAGVFLWSKRNQISEWSEALGSSSESPELDPVGTEGNPAPSGSA